MLIESTFQLFEALCQLVVGTQYLAELDEGAHDGDVHLYCPAAFEDAR